MLIFSVNPDIAQEASRQRLIDDVWSVKWSKWRRKISEVLVGLHLYVVASLSFVVAGLVESVVHGRRSTSGEK